MSHQVSGIVHLPQDVLLELAKQLDVADLMSVLATCRLIRELRLQRSLWIEALARIKAVQMQPLPFTNTDEIGTLSLHQLQDIVQRVEHLINNFQSDNPRPVRIRTLSLAASIDTIFCIPGANLAVSHTIGTVCVWDILTSHRVGYLEVPDLIVHPRALCLEIKGQALIGASISRDAANLVAICIDYRDRAHISMSHVISSNVNPALSTGFFITSRVLGFCSGNRIAFWSMVPGEGVHFIPGDIYRPVTLFSPASLCCQPVGGSLYILCYPLIGEDTTRSLGA
ncbi:hypothetical protein C8R44DRAFT_807244 [Mycena epipterygia]|nr:hypothetical protein C8R44DRAFT_807244 [Mycena epipterygia]